MSSTPTHLSIVSQWSEPQQQRIHSLKKEMHILPVNALSPSVLRSPRTTGPLRALIGFDQMKSYRKAELLQLNLVKLQGGAARKM